MMIADLHIHSKYSRATSRDCDLPHLDLWARRKGIRLLGTGDFTHPAWRRELAEQLAPAEEGLYVLREELRLPDETAGGNFAPRFVLTGEISSIYKKNGRTRKVHNVLLLPGLEAAEAMSHKLEAIGNIHSDGRPILGLDSRDLLAILLDTAPDGVFIPAHIWTPHFSVFGAFSGFDTLEECFEELTPHIHAVETGLSSDPPMNWRVSALDRLLLVSHSDAHSPAKLGREGDLLDIELSYSALARALETGEGFAGTLEFFPEEGKYHMDGHRNCGLCLTPAETESCGGKCPVCGKKITIGVEHRVEELADRPEGSRRPDARPFESIVPLPEAIAASTGASAAGKRTLETYAGLLRELGPEFDILRSVPPEEIERIAGPCVAEGIRRLRAGRVERVPGYDGEYGKITLLHPEEIEALNGQVSLFGAAARPARKKAAAASPLKKPAPAAAEDPPPPGGELNPEQRQAVEATEPVVAVVAGPGTGKTKTLVARIAHLVEERGVKPGEITAVTFTNQAAAEMRERLEARLGGKRAVQGMTIGTFHAICLHQLGDVTLLGEAEALELAAGVLAEQEAKGTPRALLQAVSRRKNGLDAEVDEALCTAYRQKLERTGTLDFDDLLLHALELPPAGKGFRYLLVDEFQDINDLQFRLVRSWCAGGKSLFVIGDPDQSIYGFRGASGRCFDRLREELPGTRVIRLVANYRSTPEVLACALPVISRNEGGARSLTAHCPSGAAVRLVNADSDFSEGVFIAKEIARMAGGVDMLEVRNGGDRTAFHPFSEIAVLARTHRQLELVEHCLRHDSIPCVVSGREDFLEADEVRGALAFFRYLLEPRDVPALRACLKLVWRAPADLVGHAARLAEEGAGMDRMEPEFAGTPLVLWLARAAEFAPRAAKEKPRRLLEDWIREGTDELTPAMEKLWNMAVFHADMPAFLQALTLGQESDLRRASGREYASGAVRLMTLHGSKGLEFPVVFLAGVKAGTLPLESPRRPCDLEEERRLFFVGMTRAREELVLLTAPEPSPFLAEIPAGLLKTETIARPREPEGVQLSLF